MTRAGQDRRGVVRRRDQRCVSAGEVVAPPVKMP